MSYADTLRHQARYYMLLALQNAEGRPCAIGMLVTMLDAVPLSFSHDQVLTEMLWLGRNGFAEVTVGQHLTTGKITYRGSDLVAGRISHPMIEKPVEI